MRATQIHKAGALELRPATRIQTPKPTIKAEGYNGRNLALAADFDALLSLLHVDKAAPCLYGALRKGVRRVSNGVSVPLLIRGNAEKPKGGPCNRAAFQSSNLDYDVRSTAP